MKQKYDFHSHSTISDGTLTPTDLVKFAASEGIEVLALTDHDNIDGIEEANIAGKKYGVEIVPGVEISIDYNPGTMHMCGYFIDIHNKELQKGLSFVQDARRNRNPLIAKKLQENGIDINIEEVQKVAGSNQIGRPHFAKIMIDKGFVKNIKEAFNKYLAKGCSCYVDKARLSLEQSTRMIINAGGIPILAHPIQLKLKNREEYKSFFLKLKDIGVKGVEIYSSHQTEEENQMFYEIVKPLGMMMTAGSDFHGGTKPNVKLGIYGEKIDIDFVKLLKKMKNNE